MLEKKLTQFEKVKLATGSFLVTSTALSALYPQATWDLGLSGCTAGWAGVYDGYNGDSKWKWANRLVPAITSAPWIIDGIQDMDSHSLAYGAGLYGLYGLGWLIGKVVKHG